MALNTKKQSQDGTAKVLEEYQESFGKESSTSFVKQGQKKTVRTRFLLSVKGLKRTNVFGEENVEEQQIKKPILRDPRKLKWMQAIKMAETGQSGRKQQEELIETKKESNTIRIENISKEFTQVMICKVFSVYGDIFSYRMVENHNVAYIAFTRTEFAKEALESLQRKIFNGQAIKLSFAPKILCNGEILLGIVIYKI